MTVHVFISGHVQGIGFRQYIRYKARKLNVQGWVKNLPAGRTETVLEGEPERVKKMIQICRKGPFLAEVSDVEVDWNYKLPQEIAGFILIKE